MSFVTIFSSLSKTLSHHDLRSTVTRVARRLDSAFVNMLMCGALIFVVGFPVAQSYAADKKGDQEQSKPFFTISEKVNLNKADAQSIAESMTGVGVKKAEAIVAWRKKHGKFTSVDQLTEVKGIGSSIVDKNRDRVSI